MKKFTRTLQMRSYEWEARDIYTMPYTSAIWNTLGLPLGTSWESRSRPTCVRE